MKTVNEVSKLTGVSVRTLHYYDSIGLLHPRSATDAGYRLYDDKALERLQQILLFRELEFPLKEIGRILDSKNFDRKKALEQQIDLLTLKKEQIEAMILFANELKEKKENIMEFSIFDQSKQEKYAKQAKEQWGETKAYQEFEKRSESLNSKDMQKITEGLMGLFVEFGKLKALNITDSKVVQQVKKLQDYISAHYYQCTDEILAGLGVMYGAGGEFTTNIDKAGGEGTAVFVSRAIECYGR